MASPTNTKLEVVAQEIRRRILTGEFTRDRRLRQDELASEFGTSITPVREALRRLEADGLVVTEPHKGARVIGVDLDRTHAAYVVRRLTEGFATRRATDRISRRDVGYLYQLVEQGTSNDAVERSQNNEEFHFYIYGRCGIPGLVEQIRHQWASFPWDLMLTTPGRSEQSQREHLAIVQALEAGTAEGAQAAFETHIDNGMAALRLHLTGRAEGGPFEED